MKNPPGSNTHDFQEFVHGYELTGTYEVEPGQKQTWTDPGYDPIVTITSIYIDGSKNDALNLIDASIIHSLTDLFFNRLEG